MIYGLDPDYDQKLEENKFLKEFNFVNDDLRFINKDGDLVDMDGRLVNEDGRYIAYRTEEGKDKKDPKEVYFVNREGEEVVAITDDDGEEEWVKVSLKERKPFLDDADEPIASKSKSKSDKDSEDSKENTAPEASKAKRARKTTKTT